MKVIFSVFLSLFCFEAFAHPTSFEDSVGVMGDHAPTISHIQLNYSWKYWAATGIHYFNFKHQNKQKSAIFASVNFLLKRWNKANYQSNIYAVFGAGESHLWQKSTGSILGLLQFDIEDRNYYFLTKYLHIQSAQSTDAVELKQATVRVGISPYVGNFSDIHTWLILEWQRDDIIGELADIDITPFVRIFYKTILIEIGHSFDGNVKFKYTSHF